MLPKMQLGPVGRAELRVFALLFPCTAPEHPHMHLSFLQGSGMKGCAATSETAAALKLLLIFILFYFIFYFFFPVIYNPLKLSLPGEPFHTRLRSLSSAPTRRPPPSPICLGQVL